MQVLEPRVGGWWKRPTKGTAKDQKHRFLVPVIDYRTNCTHSLSLPGHKCCFCGAVVP